MDQGGNPKIIIEVLLDHATSAPNRHRPGLGGLFDDRDSGLGGLNDGVSSKMGTVAFDGKSSSSYILLFAVKCKC